MLNPHITAREEQTIRASGLEAISCSYPIIRPALGHLINYCTGGRSFHVDTGKHERIITETRGLHVYEDGDDPDETNENQLRQILQNGLLAVAFPLQGRVGSLLNKVRCFNKRPECFRYISAPR